MRIGSESFLAVLFSVFGIQQNIGTGQESQSSFIGR